MRSIITMLVLGSSLALAGCNTPQQQAEIDAAVAQARSAAVVACGFEPTAQTLIGIAEQFAPSYASAIDLGRAVVASICKAVNQKSARLGSAPLSVSGVPVHGTFRRSGLTI